MVAKKNTITSSKKSSVANKETIYIDVDDEITHIIDRVKASDSKIVALVLPKRATVLQSLVNMKLLKRSAVASKKNLVLITTEPGLMPLAGAAGLHVAKSLQSKPEIPSSPDSIRETEVEDLDDVSSRLDKSESVGSLADASEADDDDVIEFDNIKTDDIDRLDNNSKLKKPKKNRKLKVPNFDKFRVGMVVAILAVILLIVGWFVAFNVMPKANIVIKTDTTSVVSSFDFTASTNQQELNIDSGKIPATKQEVKKTDTEKGTATGERDEGTRASGSVLLSVECSPANFGMSIPAGVAVSSGGLNFITQEKATLNSLGSGCTLTDSVKVLASENGDKYNLASGKTFTVAGFSSVTGKNSADMTGGSSKIVKFVTQKDVDEAVSRIKTRQADTVKDELASELESNNLWALKETYFASEPTIKPTPAIEAEASDFTINYEATFSMLGVKRDDLLALVKHDVEGEIDYQKQSIIDDGINTAVMRINNAKADQALISFRTTVVAGPELDQDAIKEAIKGKKRGEAESYIKGIKGVQDVTIDYSPFWIYKTPKSTKKITITIEKPTNTNQDDANNSDE